MRCTQWNDEWVAHLYGELEAPELARLRAHLATCAGCRETLDELEGSRRLLRRAAEPVPYSPRVLVLPRARMRRPMLAFAAGLACAAALFGVGLFAGLRLPVQEPQEIAAGGQQPLPGGAVVVSRSDLDDLVRKQQMLEERLAHFERSIPMQADQPQLLLSRNQFDQAVSQLKHQWELDQARNMQFLLEEINATEFRAGRWVDETRAALQFVALQNDPRVNQR